MNAIRQKGLKNEPRENKRRRRSGSSIRVCCCFSTMESYIQQQGRSTCGGEAVGKRGIFLFPSSYLWRAQTAVGKGIKHHSVRQLQYLWSPAGGFTPLYCRLQFDLARQPWSLICPADCLKSSSTAVRQWVGCFLLPFFFFFIQAIRVSPDCATSQVPLCPEEKISERYKWKARQENRVSRQLDFFTSSCELFPWPLLSRINWKALALCFPFSHCKIHWKKIYLPLLSKQWPCVGLSEHDFSNW